MQPTLSRCAGTVLGAMETKMKETCPCAQGTHVLVETTDTQQVIILGVTGA